MLKLDLQFFSDDAVTDTGTDSTTEVTENQVLSESEAFEELYYNGYADDTEETGDDAVNTDSEEVLGGDTDQTDGSDPEIQSQQQPWKNEQNARFAAERRRAEEAQRIAQATQAARDAVYAEQFSGRVNPYTNQPIRNEADYKAYMQAYNAEILQNAGIQQEQFDQIVNADPRVLQAQQIIAQQQAMQMQSQQMMQQQKLNDSVAKIKQFDKSVRTEQDIIDNPHFQEITEMYQRGYSLEDAYYLANRAELEQKRQAATNQRVINQVAGKQHMKTTGQNGAGNDVHIPADEMAMYRAMNPGVSDEAIRRHYARITKK
jgi:hypothetical protein